ncbi:hypothetical protein, partial [Burkholderia cenocepacia]|uniref:hypothetical protein n=1 Tax=Burkholderia cenocepacia TaxID=95486 RepID=UPI001F3C7B5E
MNDEIRTSSVFDSILLCTHANASFPRRKQILTNGAGRLGHILSAAGPGIRRRRPLPRTSPRSM